MKEPLKLTAYNTIKDRIVNCVYPPGSRLNEEALTAELGISRTPVRDALGRLEQEGLVRILPKRGLLITPISASDITALYEMRRLVEPYCIEQYGSRLSDEFFDMYHSYFSAKATAPHHDLDDRFHSAFVEASGNTYLLDLYSRMSAQNQRIRIMSGQISRDRYLETQAEHLALVEACQAGLWSQAAALSRQHLLNSQSLAEKLAFPPTSPPNNPNS